MNFAELKESDIRLLILHLLAEAKGYTENDEVLCIALTDLGHKLSRDKLRGVLSWLYEQGLIQVQDVLGMYVAKLTARGADVASGAAEYPGIRRRGPEA